MSAWPRRGQNLARRFVEGLEPGLAVSAQTKLFFSQEETYPD